MALALIKIVVPYAITFDNIHAMIDVLGVSYVPDNAYLDYSLEKYDNNKDKHLTLQEYYQFADENKYLYIHLLNYQYKFRKFFLGVSHWEDIGFRKTHIQQILYCINNDIPYPPLPCIERLRRSFEKLKHPYEFTFYMSEDDVCFKGAEIISRFYGLYNKLFINKRKPPSKISSDHTKSINSLNISSTNNRSKLKHNSIEMVMSNNKHTSIDTAITSNKHNSIDMALTNNKDLSIIYYK